MLDVAGNIKFGTADANKNLGTGENDYSAQLDGYYTFSKTTLFATAGYKVIGAPAGITVNNMPTARLYQPKKPGYKQCRIDAGQSSKQQRS